MFPGVGTTTAPTGAGTPVAGICATGKAIVGADVVGTAPAELAVVSALIVAPTDGRDVSGFKAFGS